MITKFILRASMAILLFCGGANVIGQTISFTATAPLSTNVFTASAPALKTIAVCQGQSVAISNFSASAANVRIRQQFNGLTSNVTVGGSPVALGYGPYADFGPLPSSYGAFALSSGGVGSFEQILTPYTDADASGSYTAGDIDGTDIVITYVVNGTITGAISLSGATCGPKTLSIAVTGAGPWSGTLSDGTAFSGTTSPISVVVNPTNSTTYTIATLSSAGCTAMPSNLTGSVFAPGISYATITGASDVNVCNGQGVSANLVLEGDPNFVGNIRIREITNFLSLTFGPDVILPFTLTANGSKAVPVPPSLLPNFSSTVKRYRIDWAPVSPLVDGNGCVSSPLSGFVDINVNPTPVISVSAAPTGDVCPGSPIVFSTTETNSVGGLFRWVAKDAANNTVGSGSNIAFGPNSVSTTLGFTCPNTANNPITFTFTPYATTGVLVCDGANVTRTVTVRDVTPPTITCPPTVTVACSSAIPAPHTTSAAFITAGGSVTDACTATASITFSLLSSVTTSGTCANKFTIDRTYLVIDACGNGNVCVQRIVVKDSIAPMLTSPAAINVKCSTDVPAPYASVAAFVTAGGIVSNNCSSNTNPSISSSDVIVPGTCVNKFVVNRTYSITDDCGNTGTSLQTITVNDDVAPTWTTMPTALNSTIQCSNTAAITAAQALLPVGTDNCAPGVTAVKVAGAFVAGATCPQAGTFTNTFTLTDVCGNVSSTFTQVITIIDNTAPTWTTTPTGLNITLQCNDATGLATAQAARPVGTDNCDATVTAVKTAGNFVAGTLCPQAGTYTNTFTLTDDCGNVSATFTQVITIIDNTAPAITTPATNITGIKCGADVPAAYTTVAQFIAAGGAVSDNCTSTASLTISVLSSTTAAGTCANKFVVTRTYLVLDACGNGSSSAQTITVNDDVAPTWTTTAGSLNRTLDCADAVGIAAAQALVPASIDNCSAATVAPVKVAGSLVSGATCASAGSITNTFTVKDICGNTSSVYTQVITITDNTAPILNTLPRTFLNVGAGANCTVLMPDYRPLVTPIDCGVVTLEQLLPNAPGSLVIGYGGTRTVVIEATDACGNKSQTSFLLDLEDFSKPTVVCKNISVSLNSAGTASISGSMVNNGSTDNCSAASALVLSVSPNTFTCANLGANTVILSVTDAAGNTSTCSSTVTISDVTPPTVICRAATVNLSAGGMGSVTAAMVNNGSSDVCTATASLVMSVSPSSFTCANLGANTVILTVTDASGNSATCSALVTVVDVTPPTAICKAITVNLSAAGTASITPAMVDNGSSDGCGAAVTLVSVMPSSFTCANAGANTVILTVSDASGNISTCSSIVTVKDVTPPSITCLGGDTTLFKDATGTNGNFVCTNRLPSFAFRVSTSDLCGGAVTISQFPAVGTIMGASVTSFPMVMTATDASGNVATCSFMMFFVDNTPPVITCPANITVMTGAGNTTCTQAATWAMPTVTDNCSDLGTPTLTRTSSIPNGGQFPVGVSTVSFTATDAAGNTSTCSFTVTVVDNTAPVVTGCPTVNVTASTGAGRTTCDQVATWTAPTATDGCGGAVTVTASHMPGAVFAVGTTMVTYTFKDAAMNTTTCMFNVVVTDNTKPVFAACPSNTTATTNTAGCRATVTPMAQTVTDNCSATPTVTWAISGATTLSGAGASIGSVVLNTGVNTILYTATDAAMNVATCSYTITVASGLQGTISGQQTVAQLASTTSTITFGGVGGTAPYTFTYNISVNGGAAGATLTKSTTGGFSITTVEQPNDILGTYTYTILSVTDVNGCTGTLVSPTSQTVTVVTSINTPDIAVAVLGGSSAFTTGQSQNYVINVFNGGTGATTAPVVITIPKRAGFTYNFNTTASSSTYNNNEWVVILDNSSVLRLQSVASLVIPATTGVKRFQLGVTATGTSNSSVIFSAIAPGGTGGGETPTTNNIGTRTLIIN